MNAAPDLPAVAEETRVHTRLITFGFGADESREFWSRMTPGEDPPNATTVFESHWFGRVSENRAGVILQNMKARYARFAVALDVLSRWQKMQPQTRRNIVHWHLQLSDPLYRDFTSDYLIERREAFDSDLYRNLVVKWVEDHEPERWALSTKREFATRLLGAAREAGLVEGKTDPRQPTFPSVTDQALGYMLRLLRMIEFKGTLLENPYMRSVGLTKRFLTDRIRGLPDLEIFTQGDLVEIQTRTPDLNSWWEAHAA